MKSYLILAIFVMCGVSPALAADEIVNIRSDGKIIDGSGKIIAIPAPNDSRNTEYDKYYKSLSANGEPVAESDFFIVADPLKGFVKKSLVSSKAQDATKTAGSVQNSTVQNGMVRKYDGNIKLIKGADIPVYDNTQVKTVY